MQFWRYCLATAVMRTALKVSLLVGTVLNVINQGDALLVWQGISWPQLMLNYLTPYAVASYSAASTQRRLDQLLVSAEKPL